MLSQLRVLDRFNKCFLSQNLVKDRVVHRLSKDNNNVLRESREKTRIAARVLVDSDKQRDKPEHDEGD